MNTDLVLVTLHVAANMVWVGSLLAAVVAARAEGGTSQTGVAIARRLYLTMATPAFGVSLIVGAVRLVTDWHHFMVATHFMHAKLVLAFGAIVAHHWIGARLKRLSKTSAAPDRSLVVSATVFGVACLGSVALVVIRPF